MEQLKCIDDVNLGGVSFETKQDLSSTGLDSSHNTALKSETFSSRLSGLRRHAATAIAMLSMGVCASMTGCDNSADASSNADTKSAQKEPQPKPTFQFIVLETQPRLADTQHPDGLPLPLSAAQVRAVDPITGVETKFIEVFRLSPLYAAAQDKALKPYHTYFHSPFGGWVVNRNAADGIPSIIHSITPRVDGGYTVRLIFSVTSQEIRDVCKKAVVEHDKDYALQGGKTEKDIDVRPSPMKNAIFIFRDPDTGQEFTTYWAKNIANDPNIDIYPVVSESELVPFLNSIINNRMVVDMYCQSKRENTAASNIELTGKREVKDHIEAEFSSEQKSGKAPIFQKQAQKAIQSVKEAYSRAVRIQKPNLVSELNSGSLEAKLFQSMQEYSLERLEHEFDDAASRFNEFIRPHLEHWANEMARQGVEISIDQNTNTKTKSGGRGGSFLGFGAKKTWTNVDQDLKRLEEITGTKWVKSEDGTHFAPHSINVSPLKEGWQKVEIDTQDTQFYYLGEENDYFPDCSIYPYETVEYGRQSLLIARSEFGGVGEVLNDNVKLGTRNAELESALKKEQDGRAEDNKRSEQALRELEQKKDEVINSKNARIGELDGRLNGILGVLRTQPREFPNGNERNNQKNSWRDFFQGLGVHPDIAKKLAEALDSKNRTYQPPVEREHFRSKDP